MLICYEGRVTSELFFVFKRIYEGKIFEGKKLMEGYKKCVEFGQYCYIFECVDFPIFCFTFIQFFHFYSSFFVYTVFSFKIQFFVYTVFSFTVFTVLREEVLLNRRY